jgi:hypothetical protein
MTCARNFPDIGIAISPEAEFLVHVVSVVLIHHWEADSASTFSIN